MGELERVWRDQAAEYVLCISRTGIRGVYVCAQGQTAWAGFQHCPDAASTWSPESWAAGFIWETIQGCNSTKLRLFFSSLFLYLVYKPDSLGKQKWCAAVSERILTFQYCQKCDVNRHTHEKTLAELLGIISAAAIYDFRSVTVFQCLKLGFSHVDLCMVLLSDNQWWIPLTLSHIEQCILFLGYFSVNLVEWLKS